MPKLPDSGPNRPSETRNPLDFGRIGEAARACHCGNITFREALDGLCRAAGARDEAARDALRRALLDALYAEADAAGAGTASPRGRGRRP